MQNNPLGLTGHVISITTDQEEKKICLHVMISAASPQRLIEINFSISHSKWSYDLLSDSFETNGNKPQIVVDEIKLINLYPDQDLDCSETTDEDIYDFCVQVVPKFQNYVNKHLAE